MSEIAITDEFEPYDEQVKLVAQPVEEVPRTIAEDTALQADLDQFNEFRRKGEAGIRASNIILR
jgi:hypothetical protein